MKKFIKIMVLACLIVPVAVLMTACGGSTPSVLKDGTYKYEKTMFNFNQVNGSSYQAATPSEIMDKLIQEKTDYLAIAWDEDEITAFAYYAIEDALETAFDEFDIFKNAVITYDSSVIQDRISIVNGGFSSSLTSNTFPTSPLSWDGHLKIKKFLDKIVVSFDIRDVPTIASGVKEILDPFTIEMFFKWYE